MSPRAKHESSITWAEGPSAPPLASLLLGIVMFLALALLGRVLFYLDSAVSGVYALLASLLLGWLAARGRYWTPTTRQYLLTMFIALIPLLGTAYAVFFAGRHLTGQRGLRILVYFLLVLSLALLVLWQIKQGEFDPNQALAFLRPKAAPTQTAAPTLAPSATREPSDTPPPTPSRTPLPTQPTVTQAGSQGCLSWSAVTLEQVGQSACVTGDYLSITQKNDQTYVLSFSEEAGTFQVWSYPRPFEPYLSQDGGRCVMVTGWIQTSGVRPIIVIGAQGKIEPCP